MLYSMAQNSLLVNKHSYSFAVTGLKEKSKVFSTRDLANEYMYRMCRKYGLNIVKKYEDNHDITYICDNGVRFYIQRV